MAGQLVHAELIHKVEPEVNKFFAVMSDSLYKKGWRLCTREESKKPETYKRNQGLLNSNGHQDIVKANIHHLAVDDTSHPNPVFQRGMEIARPEVSGMDFHFLKLNEDCMTTHDKRDEIKAHVIAELAVCYNLYLRNKDLPYVFDEAIDNLDRPGTAEALFIMFPKDLGLIVDVVDNHLEDYIYKGRMIEKVFGDYGDIFRYVARKTPGLDTESGFQGFMRELHESSYRKYKQYMG